MNKNLFRILPIVLTIALISGCILHNNEFNTPDIVLKKDGQLCISIPENENFFYSKKEYSILTTEVFQTGIGQLWKKNYFYPSEPYYVKNQECLYFNYHFQNNIFYTISFISTEKGNNENQKSIQKTWIRFVRIIKKPDGTFQLLLDGKARDYS